MHRPSKNLVLAAETLPAQFRPSNQARLVRASASNPGPSDPGAMLPGMGEVQFANGISSNGLASGAADRRFALTIAALREKQERERQIAATGSPNAAARPKLSASIAQAVASMPAAPQGPQAPLWEHVDTLVRPNGTRWVITRRAIGRQPARYAVTLYRTGKGREDQIVRSDNLASEATAREYIRAYEVRHGDTARVGAPRKVGYWAGILRKGEDRVPPSASSVAAVRRAVAQETRASVNGLGELATQPLVLGALAIGALFFLHKSKRA